MLENLKDFFGTNSTILADVKDACTEVTFKRGSTILAQEDDSKTVYCLLSGEAKALLFSEDGDEVWLDEFKEGDLFGEIAMLSGEPRSADIVAMSKVTVAIFSEEIFLKLMEKHGTIGIRISKMLARRVQKTTRRLFELNALSAKGRVYAELLRVATPVAGTDMFEIAQLPNFTVFAKKVNSTRETVSRTVNELERMGFVKREGHRLILTDRQSIEDLERW